MSLHSPRHTVHTPLGITIGRIVAEFHEMNAAQRALFESYLDLDRYTVPTPEPEYLHWELGGSGWHLRGSYAPASDGGASHNGR